MHDDKRSAKPNTILNKRIKRNNGIQIKVSFPFSSRRLIVDINNGISEIKKRKGTHRRNENNAQQLISLETITESDDYFTLERNEFVP